MSFPTSKLPQSTNPLCRAYLELLTCTQFIFIMHSFNNLLQLQIYFLGKILLMMLLRQYSPLIFSFVSQTNSPCCSSPVFSSVVQLNYFLCSLVYIGMCSIQCIHTSVMPGYVCFVVMFVLVIQTLLIVMFALEYFVVSGHNSIMEWKIVFGITLQEGFSNWLMY